MRRVITSATSRLGEGLAAGPEKHHDIIKVVWICFADWDRDLQQDLKNIMTSSKLFGFVLLTGTGTCSRT